jgi:hypothetical protein
MPDDVWSGSSTCSLSSDGLSIIKGRQEFYKAWPSHPEKNMDIEVHKQAHNEALEVPGVTKIKAFEAVGGKKGKYFMYAGYVRLQSLNFDSVLMASRLAMIMVI